MYKSIFRAALALTLALAFLLSFAACDNTPAESADISEGSSAAESTASGGEESEGDGMTSDTVSTPAESSAGSTSPAASVNTGGKQSTAASPKTTTAGNTTVKKSNRTVTYSGKLDKAVTAKATFTGRSGKPNFTADQKAKQKEAGRSLIQELIAAAKDTTVSTFVIPAGNYGFDMLTTAPNGVASGIIIQNIQRTAANPFTIEAEGTTFWFEMTGKACASVTRGLQFINCSHVYLDGLTMDGYSAFSIDGTIKTIDRSGNRIGIQLCEGTMEPDAATIEKAVKGSEFRIVTVKADGALMAPLYNINNQWGPGSLQGSDLSVDSDGTCWFTFKTRTLMDTIFTNEWKSFYGSNGTLETGDQVTILYGVVLALCLDNCQQMRMTNIRCYISKGGWWENGGYGDHLWKDCYFGVRPGTNRVLGAEGNMSQGLRHGSTYDGIVFGLTTDDAVNIHGFWSKAKSVMSLADGYSMKVSQAPVGIRAGDPVEFYTSSGKLVATCTVKTDPVAKFNYNGFLSSPVILKEEPPQNYADLLIRWPNSECDGFVIRNCRFENVYQRVLVNSGSGLIENNLFLSDGSNLSLTSNTGSYEGGIMKNIAIRNNVFYNTANHPGGSAVGISQTTNWANYLSGDNISLTDNVFVNCGKLLTAANIKNMTVTGNLIVNPLVYGQTVTRFEDIAMLSKASCSTKAYSGNTVYLTAGTAAGGDNPIKLTTAAKVSNAVKICRDDSLLASAMAKRLRGLF